MTTTDGSALLAAILAHPDEDTPRLVYADWLDEQAAERSEPVPCPRAEFIRVQCELAQLDRTACAWVVEGGPDCESWNSSRDEGRVILWCSACLRARELRNREDKLHNTTAAMTWRKLPWGLSARSDCV